MHEPANASEGLPNAARRRRQRLRVAEWRKLPARALLASGLLLVCTALSAAPDLRALAAEVETAERSFARSMAERKHEAFTAHLSEQAVFFGGGGKVLRGKAAVAAGWRGFFDGPAPFTWEPDHVEVLADGTLALSTGPVRDPKGQLIARFNSIWRQEAPGVWRIVFDKGQPPP